ncbi:MAG: hypothetical protein QM478_05380 [Flavobacteriaceae bacterium]
MKKVILSAMALLIGVVGFTQNSSLVTQIGTNNADVTQNVSNTSVVYQDGTSNDAQVDQIGSNNSDVNQDGDGNTADVDQNDGLGTPGFYVFGMGPFGAVPGEDNVSEITQVGTTNNAKVNQDGNGNFSNVDQDGTSNDANIMQMGGNNDSDINQDGHDHLAVVDQDGIDNKSFITQEDKVTSGGNEAYVNQSGKGNYSTIYQQKNQLANVDQSGKYNVSIVNQTGHANVTDIDQVGGVLGGLNFSNVNQHNAIGNYAKVAQDGLLNNSDVDQTGKLNNANINQDGGGNVSISKQVSDYTFGDGFPYLPNFSQVTTVTQNGSLNYANVDQDGHSNSSSIDQTSPLLTLLPKNEAIVGQMGSYNVSDIIQNGDNSAIVSQTSLTGLGNNSIINQLGANTATVTQVNP